MTVESVSTKMLCAIAHKNNNLGAKHSIWLRWKYTWRSQRLEAVNIQRAAMLVFKRRIRYLLVCWRGGARQRQEEDARMQSATRLIFHRVLKGAVAVWAYVISFNRVYMRVLRRCENRYQNAAVCRCFAYWQERVQEKQHTHSNARRGAQLLMRHTLRYFVTNWSSAVRVKRSSHANTRRCAQLLVRRTLRHVVTSWCNTVRVTRTRTHILRKMLRISRESALGNASAVWTEYTQVYICIHMRTHTHTHTHTYTHIHTQCLSLSLSSSPSYTHKHTNTNTNTNTNTHLPEETRATISCQKGRQHTLPTSNAQKNLILARFSTECQTQQPYSAKIQN